MIIQKNEVYYNDINTIRSDQSAVVSISSVPERKKRKSKWDQTTLPGGVKETPSSQDASVSAAAAAARLNAMLEAQGKLNRQMVNSI